MPQTRRYWKLKLEFIFKYLSCKREKFENNISSSCKLLWNLTWVLTKLKRIFHIFRKQTNRCTHINKISCIIFSFFELDNTSILIIEIKVGQGIHFRARCRMKCDFRSRICNEMTTINFNHIILVKAMRDQGGHKRWILFLLKLTQYESFQVIKYLKFYIPGYNGRLWQFDCLICKILPNLRWAYRHRDHKRMKVEFHVDIPTRKEHSYADKDYSAL